MTSDEACTVLEAVKATLPDDRARAIEAVIEWIHTSGDPVELRSSQELCDLLTGRFQASAFVGLQTPEQGGQDQVSHWWQGPRCSVVGLHEIGRGIILGTYRVHH